MKSPSKDTPFYPMLFGGGQERSFRPGTENTGMIAGLGEAAQLVVDHLETYSTHMRKVQKNNVLYHVIHIIPHHTVLYHILYHTILYYTYHILHHTLLYYILTIPYHSAPHVHHTIPHHTTQYQTIPKHAIQHHTTLYHTIPHYSTPYHIIPYQTIPHYTIPINIGFTKSFINLFCRSEIS